jgi:nucleoid-associated protein YgaU
MFGRDEKKLDLGRVQETVAGVRVNGVRNLAVRPNGEIFEVHGHADSIANKQRAFEQITAKLGDTGGIVNYIQVAAEQPQNQNPVPVVQAPQGTDTTSSMGRTHTVARGETLSHIAQKHYGNASAYQKIFDANRDQLNDPDKIRTGMKLRIP